MSRLHSGYAHPVTRMWQSCGSELLAHNLMWPIFVIDNPDKEEPVHSMPGISRMGVNKVLQQLDQLVPLGLKSVLLFAVTDIPKDDLGSAGVSDKNPAIIATRMIKDRFGDQLCVACDICLCPYTLSGHCGVFFPESGEIDNETSVKLLGEMAAAFAKAGVDVVAPSDMMDGRVAAIKAKLKEIRLDGKVSVLSYSTKFASNFYGPFREAAHSAPTFGDRKRYQLPLGSRGLAIRAADRDVNEGADMLMVKPGLAYLDLVREIKNRHPYLPMFVYQVSGEYAMLLQGGNNPEKNRNVIMEVMNSMRRAGAEVIISYFTPVVLKWIQQQSN